MIQFDKIPQELRDSEQWLLWRNERRGGKPTKVPYQTNGSYASSTDQKTWTTFALVCKRFNDGGYDGIGFVFSKDDPYCGIDLDGCRTSQDGQGWARKIIRSIDSYAEVSPSATGVKIFLKGTLPFTGRKKELDVASCCDKQPGIEVYDQGRYFAVTGMRLANVPLEPQWRQKELNNFCSEHWPEKHNQVIGKDFYSPSAVIERARRYLTKIPPAVSGHSGHNRTFHAACILICGFTLQKEEALTLLSEWNQSCQPPWSEKELEHKVNDALKAPGPRAYLRNAQPEQWDHLRIPQYKPPQESKQVDFITLSDATGKYLARLRAGDVDLIDTGLPDLDGAMGGGVESGEMIVLAARPSHGKSLVALQCVHNWTAMGMPVLFVTEEMSPIALGKRTLQYASALPGEHWPHDIRQLERDVETYATGRKTCYIAANCGTVEAAANNIERAVKEHDIKAAVIDYAQLLQSEGRSRYEQVSHTSQVLRRVANEQKIVLLVLCQMSRAIEQRKQFLPAMSDIKETGQFEQDADSVIFVVWPHRIDSSRDPREFKFYIAKNRNRAINQSVVTCRIEPSRQMLMPSNYVDALSEWDTNDVIVGNLADLEY